MMIGPDISLALYRCSVLPPVRPQTMPSAVHDALRTPGAPLDPDMRAFFEPTLAMTSAGRG